MNELAIVSCVAASALLYGAAFPPYNAVPAAWVALVPMLIVLRRADGARVWFAALVWSELTSIAVAHAMIDGVATYFDRGLVSGWAFALTVWFFTVSLYLLAFAAACRRFSGRLRGRARAGLPFLIAAAWVGAEMLRVRAVGVVPWFTGNPVGLLAYTQASWTSLIQLASLTGPYGVSFLVAAVNAALAECWLARRDMQALRTAAAGLTLASLLSVLAALGGATMVPDEPTPASRRVAVVQGNVDLGARWRREFRGRNLDVYVQESVAVLRANPGTELLFWPEGALTFQLEREAAHRRVIARLLRAARVSLVVGGPYDASGPEDTRFTNAVFSLAETGETIDRSDKMVLLPFAEYLPFERADPNARSFDGMRSFSPGAELWPLETRLGKAGVLVCNEALQPELAARLARRGAAYLVNPANDTWLDGEQWAQTTMASVAFRAVEQRRFVVRSSTSGPSGVIDPYGRPVATTPHGERASVAGAIEPLHALSPYARAGDSFGVLCLLFAVAACFVTSRRRERGGGVA